MMVQGLMRMMTVTLMVMIVLMSINRKAQDEKHCIPTQYSTGGTAKVSGSLI